MAKKKSPFLWRAVKFTTIGTAKLIGKSLFYLGKGAFAAGKYGYNKIKKQKSISQNPAYKIEPKIEPLKMETTLSGDYGSFESRLLNESVIALVFGKRGSGKSALGFKILENIYGKTKRKCFVLGVSESVLPEWISPIENIEQVPNNSIVLVDEGAIAFNSRESMKSSNKSLGSILAIARHKNLSILFITQNTGMIDKNVLKLSDILFIKQGSLLQLEMERPEIKKFYEKAESSIKDLEGEKRKYVYVIDSDFEGVVSHSLPGFWSDNISKNQGK